MINIKQNQLYILLVHQSHPTNSTIHAFTCPSLLGVTDKLVKYTFVINTPKGTFHIKVIKQENKISLRYFILKIVKGVCATCTIKMPVTYSSTFIAIMKVTIHYE
jgi:hypothetical protein